MVANGHGRPLLFLRNNPSTQYRDIILDACLHNRGLDRQIDGNRAGYMYEFITLFKDMPDEWEFYRRQILDALAALDFDSDDYDIEQVYGLGFRLADDGDQTARTALYDKFTATPALADFAGAYYLVQLDGLPGLFHIAEQLGEHLLKHGDTFGDSRYILTDSWVIVASLDEFIDLPTLETELQQRRATNPAIAAFFDTLGYGKKQERKPRERRDPATIRYEEIRELLPTESHPPFPMWQWGKVAKPEDIQQVAADIIAADEVSVELVNVFRHRVFPENPEKLFQLAMSPDRLMRAAAVNALANLDDPTVRAFALQKLDEGYAVGRMIRLLVNNFEDEDWQRLETLTSQELDRETMHDVGWGFTDIFRRHPVREAIPTLLNLYEYDPCSQCRERFVECLHRLQALPDWMREECLYDANDDLRNQIRTGFRP